MSSLAGLAVPRVAAETRAPLVITFAAGRGPWELRTDMGLTLESRVYPFAHAASLQRVWRATLAGDAADYRALESSGIFESLSPDLPVNSDTVVPSEPYFTTDGTDSTKQWWSSKLRIPEAWELSKGSRDTVVAIVDTGINGRHEELNDGRVGSGYITYCQVENPIGGQCLVHISASISANENSDDNGHGTLVAGLIGAIPNNGKGIAGVNWNVRLMPIKTLNSNGAGVSSDVAAGIVWATDNGASIINLSLGGNSLEGNTVLTNALSYAFDHSVLVVAAAGNDAALVGSDLDINPVYPVCDDAGRNLVLGVAAVDINDRKAGFSNYGRSCIDLSAPGVTLFNTDKDQKGMLSTYFDPARPTNNSVYAFASGTSIAAPLVSGIAALLKSLHPDLSGAALRDRIIGSTDNIDSANPDNCQGISCTGRLGSGRINALKALEARNLTSDSLIKDSSGRIFLIENGLKRPVSDFVFGQRGYSSASIKNVAATEIETIPQGSAVAPLDGTLVKGENTPTVYTVSNGILLPASYLSFVSNGFNFSTVVTVPDSEIPGYTIGPNLVPGNGALMRASGTPAVYFMHEGKKRLISYFSFLNRGLKWEDVVPVGSEEFDRYRIDPTVTLEPPLDGTLLRGDKDTTIYLVQDGQLRSLSLSKFEQMKFQFSQVNIIPESELQGYPHGEAVL
ncbi:MAG TPA: S8 family serine peptidase [Patescibacteria group bacterium]|nr:S8 family serine peptidase [Patescibacteria group bacterium]